MKNPAMEETIFDAVLTRAFADAFAEELAEIERACPETAEYPEKYRKIERKAYRKRWGGGGFRMSRGMKRAAAWILAVGLVGGALVMSVPTVRAGFNNLVATAFEKYVSFESAASVAMHVDLTGGYRYEYIPENYQVTEEYDLVGIEMKFESLEDDTYFWINYFPEDAGSILYDNEHTDISEHDVNGNNAFLLYFRESDDYILTWNDGEHIFEIDGNISSDEILKIARNIFRIE